MNFIATLSVLLMTTVSFADLTGAYTPDYAKLSRAKRTVIENELQRFVPDYADAMLRTLQDIYRFSTGPINSETYVDAIAYTNGESAKSIFEKNSPKVLQSNTWAQTTNISMEELLGAVHGGMSLKTILAEKPKLSPEKFEKRFLNDLDIYLDVSEEEENSIRVWVAGMARPYCGITIEAYLNAENGQWDVTSSEECD